MIASRRGRGAPGSRRPRPFALRHEETLRCNELGGLIADHVYGPSVTAAGRAGNVSNRGSIIHCEAPAHGGARRQNWSVQLMVTRKLAPVLLTALCLGAVAASLA